MSNNAVYRISEKALSKQGKWYRKKIGMNHRAVDISDFQEATTSKCANNNDNSDCNETISNESSIELMDLSQDLLDDFSNNSQSNSDEGTINDSSSECDSDDFFFVHEKRSSLKEEIRQWYLRDPAITQTACNSLLKILNKNIGKKHDLPSDIRTLVRKHEKLVPKTISGGESIYFGLKMYIKFISKSLIDIPQNIYFDINIDGAPIFDNPYSSVSIWPILLLFKNIKGLEHNVFPISVFCGSKKPDSLEFIDDFINEYKSLQDGLTTQGKTVKVKLDLIRMDAPAHSFLCQIKSHSGYFACFKCEHPGEYYGHKVIYPYIDEEATRRTNVSFRERSQENHHIGESNLLKIDHLDMIDHIPIDSMHCVYLGVMKKLLSIWFVTKNKNKNFLSNECFKAVSKSIKDLKGKLPSEFHRNLRNLDAINRYKAKELRMFLLYIGPLVLKRHLSKERFTHFMYLHCAIKILSDEIHSKDINMRNMAKRLISLFCIGMEEIYGKEYCSFNLHLLTHLHEEVALHGPLDKFSNFVFENFLGHLKKHVNSPFNPLQQIANRTIEIVEYSLLEKNKMMSVFNTEKQTVEICGIKLTCSFPNSIVQFSSSEIIRITKIEKIQERIYISGVVLDLYDYFKEPIRSSSIGCYLAKENSFVEIKKDLTFVSRKMVPFKVDDFQYLIIPMTHNIR